MDLDTEVRPQGNLECFSGNRVLPHSSDSLPLTHSDHSTKGASGAEFHDDSSMHTTRHKNCDAGEHLILKTLGGRSMKRL